VAVFVGKQTHGSDQSGSGGDPVHQRKRILHFGFGHLNDEPIFAGVAASTVSGALEAFVRAAAIELLRDCVSCGESHDAKESESQFAQFFAGMIPVEGWKVGQAYKRAILGAKPAALQKLIELTQRLFEDRPSTFWAVRRRGVRFVNGHII